MLKPEYSLKTHQEDAVATAVKRDGNILLSHPVGSGKTLSSIAVFERLKDLGHAKRVLVVTPASLRQNYGENGVKKFTDSDYAIYGNQQEVSSDKTGKFKRPSPDSPEYGIVSYELFREDPKKFIEGHGADTVVFDEVHRIKNDTSKTFTSLKEARPLFRNFIGMTGSIVSNTPADVVPLIDAMTMGNHKIGSKASFENRFVGKDSKGNKTVINPILVRSLMAPYVHHVTDEQLEEGTGLKRPDKYINQILVPLSGQHEEYYRYAIGQLDPLTKAKLAHGLGKLGKAELDAIFSKMLKSRQVANSMATLDPNMSLEESAEKSVKIKRLLDDVQEHLGSTKDAQVIIHSELIKGGIDVLEAGLKKRGIEYGKFIGKGNEGVNEKTRQQDVDDYNAGKKKVILISAAGGEGLDLPNTTLVASLDGHWNPEKISQVEARGIRMGGLSHRAEKDRKVIVNRYITKLPISNIDTFKQTRKLLSPSDIFERIMSKDKILFNPHKAMPTVDQLMYAVAKAKAHGNSQLKDLFDESGHQKVASWKSSLVGAGAGGVIGAAGGYAASSPKDEGRNALIGGVSGALAGAGAGYYLGRGEPKVVTDPFIRAASAIRRAKVHRIEELRERVNLKWNPSSNLNYEDPHYIHQLTRVMNAKNSLNRNLLNNSDVIKLKESGPKFNSTSRKILDDILDRHLRKEELLASRTKMELRPELTKDNLSQIEIDRLKQHFAPLQNKPSYMAKLAEYSFQSDRQILNDYIDKYGPTLLSGDFQDKYINEEAENKYINKLRQYYSRASRKDVIAIAPKKYDEYVDRTQGEHFKQTFVKPAILTGLGTAAYMGINLAELLKSPGKPRLLALAGMAGAGLVGGTIAGVGSYRATNKPHFTTTAGVAKKRQQLSDEDLLKILRGEAVRKEEIKATDHFIRIK